jgi:hypothetical protein
MVTLLICLSWFTPTGPVDLDEPGGAVEIASDAIQPHIAVDSDGDIYVTFLHKGNIAVSVSRDRGTSFSQPVVAINVQGRMKGGMHRGPRIGVDAKKNLIVTAPAVFDDSEFKNKYPTADLYFVSSRDGGQSWTDPIRVNEVPKQAPESLHWLAVTPSGEAHVAWLDRRDRQGPGQDIFYAKVVDGRVGKNSQVAATVCECCAPGLAVDATGNALLAYREGGQKPSREVFAIRSTDHGANFSKPTQVNGNPTQEDSCPMSAPAVAVSADGKKFVVAWKDLRIGRNDPHVYWSISNRSDSFEDAPIDFEPGAKQNHPSVALDRVGTAWVAWEDTRSKTQRIWVRNSKDKNRGEPISDLDEGEASFPSLAVNRDIVAVVYETANGNRKNIKFRLLGRSSDF